MEQTKKARKKNPSRKLARFEKGRYDTRMCQNYSKATSYALCVCRCNLERIEVPVNHQLSVNRKKFLLCCSSGPYATPQSKTVWEYRNLLKTQTTPQFDSDFQVQLEAGKDLTPFKTVVQLLEQQLPLPATHVDSQYVGSPGWWCCRISFDWWLIYKVDLKAGTITFEHTGSWKYLFE